MRRPPAALLALGLSAVLLTGALPALAQSAEPPEPVDPAVTACPPAQVPGARFLDVPADGATALAIDCLAGYGLARGASGGGFGRTSGITRAQAALFLDRVTAYAVQASGSSARRSGTADFDDLDDQLPEIRAAVGRLAAEGVVRGSDADGDGRASYRPAEPVTRGQIAAILVRAMDSISVLLTGSAPQRQRSGQDWFDDDAGVFEADIDHLVSSRIAVGTGPRRFSPAAGLTRQQSALFVARLLEVEASAGRVPSRYAPDGRPLDGPPVATPGSPVQVATGLALPWDLAPLPDGGALVSERDSAQIKRVAADGAVTTLGTVPGVAPGGEGGLLGLALSPSFGTDGVVFAYLTSSSDNRVVRFRLAPGPVDVQPVVTGIPKGNVHNGGRLAFGPDGMLHVATGDAGVASRGRDLASLGGKVLRVRPDGSVPPDNPRPGSRVLTSGHRNVQGLAFDGGGRLWATEFGANTADEVNLLRGGRDHGWNEVEGIGRRGALVDPLVTWTPAEASPSGAAVAGGSLWVASLRGQRLWQVPLDGDLTGRPRAHLVGQAGRLRDVVQVADGSLWVLTNESPGRVLRVPLG